MGHKVEFVSGDISGNNATLYLHMHHLSLSGMCVIEDVDLEPYITCTVVGHDQNIYSTLPTIDY